MTEKYTCPVCGWGGMEDAPANDEICDSCGTHFGYDDFMRSHAELRSRWLNIGKPFFMTEYKPENWNPIEQLKNIGIIL